MKFIGWLFLVLSLACFAAFLFLVAAIYGPQHAIAAFVLALFFGFLKVGDKMIKNG